MKSTLSLLLLIFICLSCSDQSDRKDTTKTINQTEQFQKEASTANEDQNLPQELIKGKALHQTNCKSCHFKDRAMVGPKLKGVRERWTLNTGNDTLIYFWVNDWKSLASKNSYADSIARTLPDKQPPFPQLSHSDIDAIFDYLDY